MKPLGLLLIAYIAGLIYFFARDYFNRDNQQEIQNNNEEKAEG